MNCNLGESPVAWSGEIYSLPSISIFRLQPQIDVSPLCFLPQIGQRGLALSLGEAQRLLKGPDGEGGGPHLPLQVPLRYVVPFKMPSSPGQLPSNHLARVASAEKDQGEILLGVLDV